MSKHNLNNTTHTTNVLSQYLDNIEVLASAVSLACVVLGYVSIADSTTGNTNDSMVSISRCYDFTARLL